MGVQWERSGQSRDLPHTHRKANDSRLPWHPRTQQNSTVVGAGGTHAGFTYVDLFCTAAARPATCLVVPLSGRMEAQAGWRHEPHEAEECPTYLQHQTNGDSQAVQCAVNNDKAPHTWGRLNNAYPAHDR